ncbi:MAG: hypothetical protein E7649_01020 [Ruminococcaceae bacterium]|nr:hypothetical protein [Oscillospiraceae bacterium]
MVKAVKKDTGNVIYMRLMKHNCPVCQKRLKVVKMTKVVKAKSREAKQFNFNVCNISLGDKVKFVWYEFKCRDCDLRFSEAEIKAAEKTQKKEAKRAARVQKKAEKAQAAKQME